VEEYELEQLDSRGYVVFEAIGHDRPPPAGSHASPHAFVCVGGGVYWIKRSAQQGLLAELVAGRLGVIVGAAPDARIVRVTAESAPSDGSASHLIGIGVGSRDQPGMENLRELEKAAGFRLDPTKLDVASRVRVLAFQTWLGVSDTQILVDMRNGRLMSIDHGDWCPDPSTRATPTVISTPSVPDDFGRVKKHVDPAIAKISSVTDRQILGAVACVPTGSDWRAERSRRLEIARWLAFRRDRLPEVMRRWRTQR
jgi:hypothetical protein